MKGVNLLWCSPVFQSWVWKAVLAVGHLHEVPLCQLLVTYFPVSRTVEMESELGNIPQRGFELPHLSQHSAGRAKRIQRLLWGVKFSERLHTCSVTVKDKYTT